MLFFITNLHQLTSIINLASIYQMAATRQNDEEQYHALINKHKQYLKIQEDYRQTNWLLKKETEKMQILNEIVYSAEYQQKINDAITKYHQLQALMQEYQQMLKEENAKPQQTESVRVQNEKLREKISNLNFQVAVQQKKYGQYEVGYEMLQRYVNKCEEKLDEWQRQIEELRNKEPFKESVWRSLGIQRIEKVLKNAEKESQMSNEQESILVKYGNFLKLIYEKIKEVQELSHKLKQDLTILKEKEILNQQLKIQNNIVSKMFGFDSFEEENDNEEDLRQEDEQLDKQIMRLQEDIKRRQEEQLHLRQNLSQIAKSSAIQKTIDYLKQKGGETKYKLKIMQETLPLILMGGSQSAHEQAQLIVKQITTMKQELLRLENGILNHSGGMQEQ